jgi:hypothetical protein
MFTNLTAVLPSYSYRMLALFRETGVIHNPCHHGTLLLHAGQHLPPHLCQHLGIILRRVRHQMMQRLVHAPNVIGCQACGHRLYTLALSKQ